MTLVEMVSEVRSQLGGISSTQMPDARIERALQWTYSHVCRPNIHRHREMRISSSTTLVAGQRAYTLPNNFYSMYHVYNSTQSYGLVLMDQRRMDEGHVPATRPQYYDITYDPVTLMTQLYLFPNVSAQYTGNTVSYRYWRVAPPLDDNAGEPATVLLEDWDEVLVVGALWRLWRARRSIERAEIYKTEFAQLANEIGDRLRADVEDKDWEIDVELQQHQEHSYRS